MNRRVKKAGGIGLGGFYHQNHTFSSVYEAFPTSCLEPFQVNGANRKLDKGDGRVDNYAKPFPERIRQSIEIRDPG